MKVAFVHEFLTQYGGAERVLEALHEIYPEAPIYTLVYNENKMGKYFGKYNIKTSYLQKTLFGKTKTRWYLSLMPSAIESFDLSEYDLVISDASAFAKGVLTLPSTIHICYCHTPTRYLWNESNSYIKTAKIPWPINKFMPKILTNLRIWDYNAAQRPDFMIANSKYISRRIKKYYNRDAEVVYPFVNKDRFNFCGIKKDYYFMAGRLVPYKKYDIVVEAFNKMPNKKLFIAGSGVYENELKNKVISRNIIFLGRVSDEKLAQYYANAKCFIFPADEDFGIAPLEAMISGTPVIAYKKGGALETVVENVTGIFFPIQEKNSLIEAVEKFEKMKFDPKKISDHANKFTKEIFIKNIKDYINKKRKD